MSYVLRSKSLPNIGIPIVDEIRDNIICGIGHFKEVQEANVTATFVCRTLPPLEFQQKYSQHKFITLDEYIKGGDPEGLTHIKGGDSSIHTIYVSKKILNYSVFSDLFRKDGHDVIEFEGETSSSNRDHFHTIAVVRLDELAEFKKKVNSMLYICISKPGIEYGIPIPYPCLEYQKSDVVEKFVKYGTNVKALYCYNGPNINDAYKWLYDNVCGLFNFQKTDDVYGQLLECMYWQYIDRWDKLHTAFNEIATKNGRTFKSTDIVPISFGMFNMVYDISNIEPNSIIRFMFNSKFPFDANAAEVLSKMKDTGFVSVHYYNKAVPYTVLDKCEPITDFSEEKYRAMLDKIRKTINENHSLVVADFHKGNIMQFQDNYVFVDIDLNIVDIKHIVEKHGIKQLDDIIDKDIPTWAAVCNFIPTILTAAGIELTDHNASLCALEISYLSGGDRTIKFTREVFEEVKKRITV